MGTPAIVGFRRELGWEATYVGYDGYPEGLGPPLLDLVAELDGDLEALRARVMEPSDGWRYAFTEAYQPGENQEWFATGRTPGSPLRHDDDFVRQHVAYWFLFDLARRELAIIEPHEEKPEGVLVQTVRFGDGSKLELDPPASGPLDWRNRRQHRGSDNPTSTANAICELLVREQPIRGDNFYIQVGADDAEMTLDEHGLMVPFTLYVDLDWRERTTKTPLFSVGSEPSRVTKICAVPAHRLLPLRALRHEALSLAFVEASLTALRDGGARGLAPTHAMDFVFSELFPARLLDLELERDTLVEAVARLVMQALGDE